MYLKPGAEMRAVADNDWEKEIKHRDTTYFLWIAIPINLGVLTMIAYCIITGNDLSPMVIKSFMAIAFVWWLVVTPMIYGLKRSLQVYAILAVICALLIGLAEWFVF